MAVGTLHITKMYDEAGRLARELHGLTWDIEGYRKLPNGDEVDPEKYFDAVLERIDNLVTHARAELVDERVRLVHQWPVV